MTLWPHLVVVVGAALSLERVSYVWIARNPGVFRAICARPTLRWLGEPVAIVRKLFCGFKLVQLSVFIGWCYLFGEGSLLPADPDVVALAVGSALLVAGQILNVSVFYRLGAVGVFYGDRLGYEVPWCRAFPFTLFAHPQYVGAVVSIWGLFLALRFPHDDWIVIPAIETVYYTVSTYFEERNPTAPRRCSTRGIVQVRSEEESIP